MNIRDVFDSEKIEYFAPLPLCDLKVIKPYLVERLCISCECGSALVLCVPYFTSMPENISAYAASRDYHLYFEGLFDRVIPRLHEMYPEYSFYGFSDHSPIDEVHAAARAGLGVIGDNHLFITEKYSSFVFIGEIISDMPAEKYGLAVHSGEVQTCCHCGNCKKSCPEGLDVASCLSALTQKKGTLCEEEAERLISHGVAWGCDRCQSVCPYTKKAAERGSIFTPIDFFYQSRIEKIDIDTLYSMTDEEFVSRAFSWRGRQTVERNLKILGGR